MALIQILGRPFHISGLPDDPYYRTHAARRRYHNGVLALLARLLTPEAECADIGANIGFTTLGIAHIAFRGHVYSFEPFPELSHYLSFNIRENGIDNVTIFPIAVSDAPGPRKLFRNPIQSGGSFITNGLVDPQNPLVVEVVADTLDRVLIRELDRPLAMIKIDVEGHEQAVLNGARRLLTEHRPAVLIEFNSYTICEMGDSNPRRFLDYLFGIFSSLFLIDRKTGAPRPLENTEEQKFRFIHSNMTTGLVDDLLCVFDDTAQARRANQLAVELRA